MAGNGESQAEGTRGNQHVPRFTLDPGPIDEVHAFWLAGMSYDGCSIAAVGAQNPSVEQLVNGNIPGLPRIVLHHPVLSATAGKEFMRAYELARDGKLGAPYVVCYEGSVADEKLAAGCGGYWSAMGVEIQGDGSHRPIPTAEWLQKLAPGAAAVIAVGTCASWGGVPAAAGNVTGSMSVMDLLGKDYLSALGLPPINIPGRWAGRPGSRSSAFARIGSKSTNQDLKGARPSVSSVALTRRRSSILSSRVARICARVAAQAAV